MLKNINLVLICLILLSTSAFAGPNNTGYLKIIEIKVWPTYIDIYSENLNVCSYADKRRMVLKKDEKEMFSLAMTAMASGMKANINYSCRADGLPNIEGIRVKP